MSQAKTREEALAALLDDVGTWDAEVEVRPGPAAEPIRFAAVRTNRLVAGRWLVSEYRAETGFEGHGLIGFDETAGLYVSSWVDSAQKTIARGEGSFDAATRTLTLSVQAGAARYREVTRTLEDGLKVYGNFAPTADGEFEMIHATYRRRV